MKYHIGFLLQLVVLVFLPAMMLYVLEYRSHPLTLPVGLAAGFLVFKIGTWLRESASYPKDRL